jgi:uncharacterized protein (DUF924 family)
MNPEAVLNFWFKELSPKDWFRKDARLDQDIRDRFSSLWLKASRGELKHWRQTPEGRLAEIIVLDQFSRNIHRDTKRAFQNDKLALTLSREMIDLKWDQKFSPDQRVFIYLPFMHSEDLEAHREAEKFFDIEGLEENLDYELRHRRILEKFGRYPHRNKILGRKSTPEEVEFLKRPGSSF